MVAIWLAVEDQENRNVVVWTYSRDDPPMSTNTTLNLTHKGELVLVSEKSSVIKTLIIKANISFAVLENNGNFVLYNNSMGVMWQSFEYPTDSILQGQSLCGGMELVSSVSKTNYSSGRFRMTMQLDGNLVMYPVNTPNESAYAYWASNTYNGPSTNSENYLYLNDSGLQIISHANSKVITYFNITKLTYSVMIRGTLDSDGIFRLYAYKHTNFTSSLVWYKPDNRCDVKNYCGFNSYCITNEKQQVSCVCLPGSDFVDLDQKSSGCKKNFTAERCRSGDKNMTYYNMVKEENFSWKNDFYDQAVTNSSEDCINSCLEECDCDAARVQGGYCSRYKYPLQYVSASYYEDEAVSFFKTAGNITLYVQANESFNASSVGMVQVVNHVTTTSRKTWVLILVITIGFSFYSCISLCFSGFFLYKLRFLKYKRLLQSRTLGLAEDLILRSYTYNELKRATNGFKQELGRGSFGTVYKGFFYKGKKPIAVKRLEKVVDEGEREFRAEMQVIGKTHHKNLVRLLGYCAEGNVNFLYFV